MSEQGDVLRHLRMRGADGTTLTTMAQRLNLSRRAVEEAVQALRLAGEPIVSDGNGIRYSTDAAEVAACAKALRRRYISQAITARALRRTARRLESAGELTLW